jgi:prepilin-type N-terminal cleavage/methylation domain-containing protein
MKRILFKKVNGFTLLEVLIVMILTSLVISLTYTYFNAFQHYIRKTIGMGEQETAILRLETLLIKDFDKASAVLFKQDSGILVVKNNKTEIQYTISDSSAIRYFGNAADTLVINGLYIKPEYFTGQDSLILALTLGVNEKERPTRSYRFFMDYPALMTFRYKKSQRYEY